MVKYDYQYYAYRDSIAAEGMLSIKLYDGCCIHCGQAMEKYLKSVCKLELLDKPELMKIHSCRRLAFELVNIFPEFNKYLATIKVISDYYFSLRYPNDDPITATKEMAEESMEILNIVKTSVLRYHKLHNTLDDVGDNLFTSEFI